MSDLAATAIVRELDRRGVRWGQPLSVLDVTGSTNDDARAAAAAGAPHGAVFLADAQTRGRGRGGHTWHSPAGDNLYLSLLLRPQVPAASLATIALAAGVAIARALEARLDQHAPVWLKWPNDVLAGPAYRKRKLAGILVDGQLRGGDVTSVVIGVGVNVHAAAFPPDIADRATSLAMLGLKGLDRSLLAAELIEVLGAAVTTFEADHLASFLPDMTRLDGLRGARVDVAGVQGIAAGIDHDGRLLVRGDQGTLTAVGTGEVTVVRGW